MKILAKRSDAIFYISAVVVPVSIFIMANINKLLRFIEAYGFDIRELKRYILYCAVVSFGICVYNSFHRFIVPKVIIEYDDEYIYINKTKGEPTIVLRFSEIKGGFSQEVVGDNTESVGVYSTASVLRIQTNNGIITIYGIENCTKVKLELTRLTKEYTKKRMGEIYTNIEQNIYTDAE